MDKLLPCPFCGNNAPGFYQDKNMAVIVVCSACNAEGPWELRASEALAAMDWNRRAPAAPDPALLALAKLGAMVLDWSPLEAGFPTIPGGVIDDMAVRSGCALEDASDGGHECWTAPGVRPAIAALLAPDVADQHEEVQG